MAGSREDRRRGEGIWLVTYDGDWRETFRPDIPSVARIYDYLLGGKDNYPADRAVGESMIAQLRVFDEATTPAHVRSRAEIKRLVAGMDILEPGLAWPGRRNGGRIPARRYPPTPPSRTTAWWSPAPP